MISALSNFCGHNMTNSNTDFDMLKHLPATPNFEFAGDRRPKAKISVARCNDNIAISYVDFADLAALSKMCNAVLAKIAFDDKVSYLNSNDICPYASAFEYRSSFKDAFTQIKKDWAGEKEASKIKLLTPAQVKAEIFDKAKSLTAKYKVKGTVTSKTIIEQINKHVPVTWPVAWE